jgi:hypothetical protein
MLRPGSQALRDLMQFYELQRRDSSYCSAAVPRSSPLAIETREQGPSQPSAPPPCG